MPDTPLFETVVNSDIAPVFTRGYPGPVHLDRSARIAAKNSFDPADAENALALLLAETLELKLGESFFTGALPTLPGEGFSVALEPEKTGSDCDYRDGRAVLRGKALSRSELLRRCEKIFSLLPLTDWLTVEAAHLTRSVTFCRLEPASPEGKFEINCAGLHGFAVEIPLTFRVCITPPEPAFLS